MSTSTSQLIEKKGRKRDRLITAVALLGLLLSFYGAFFWQPHILPPDAIEIGSFGLEGVVKRRHSKTLVWLWATTDDLLYLKDSVYTPDNQLSRVDLGQGLSLDLMPRTLVYFDRGRDGLIEILLMGGSVRAIGNPEIDRLFRIINLSSGKRMTLNTRNLAPGGQVFTNPDESSPQLGKGVLAEGSEFSSASALAEAAAATSTSPALSELGALGSAEDLLKQAREVSSLTQQALVNMYFKLPGAVQAIEINTSPLNRLQYFDLRPNTPKNSKKMNIVDNPWVEFNWSPIPVPTKSYQFEVAENPEFKNSLSHQMDKARVIAQINRTGTYYWRVWVYHGTQAPMVSRVHQFSYEIPENVPASLNLDRFTMELAYDKGFEKKLYSLNTRVPYCPIRGLIPSDYYCRIFKTKNKRMVRQYKMSVLPSMSNSSKVSADPFTSNRVLSSE